MSQENIQLLLQDLCTRQPYGVKVQYDNGIYNIDYISALYEEIKLDIPDNYTIGISEIKPYLRSISSMTEEEFTKLKEYSGLICGQLDLTSFQNGAYKCLDFYLSEVPSGAVIRVFDWLNKYHFDYRDLIQMGLALEAQEGMYKL